MALIENQPHSDEEERHLVLIGGGHSHVHVLKILGDRRKDGDTGVRLTVISSVRHTPYSGMLPGYLAGHYTHEQIHLDVLELTQHAGGQFIHAPAIRVEVNEGGGGGTVHLGPLADTSSVTPLDKVHYDCLSINIGSSPGAVPSTSVIPVKPISTFCQQYQSLLDAVQQRPDTAPAYRVCVVGGGAGGVELALVLQHRLLSTTNLKSLELEIITRSAAVLESLGPAVQRKFQRILRERNVAVTTQTSVTAVEAVGDASTQQRIVLADGTERRVDACFWCATAESAQWLSNATPFACTPKGNFLRVDETYQCVGFAGVFAAGDCCYMDAHPRPRAGVFAVRAGPILVENILRYLQKQKQPLIRHRPQERFLQLISTGDQYAVASRYAHVALEGKWLWRLKDRIDRKWMEKYTIQSKSKPQESSP